MYSDPGKIRKHTVKLRFSDEEIALVDAVINYTGEQKAALLRTLILNHAMEILDVGPRSYEGALPVLMAARTGT